MITAPDGTRFVQLSDGRKVHVYLMDDAQAKAWYINRLSVLRAYNTIGVTPDWPRIKADAKDNPDDLYKVVQTMERELWWE